MPRRRVLLMASSMRGGGSELQTAMLARHLDRERFDVHLYLTDAVGDLLSTIPADVTIHHPPESFPPQMLDRIPGGMLKRQAEWFRDLVEQAQVDVIYDRTFHMTLIAGHQLVQRGLSVNRPRVSTIVSPPEVALPLVEKRFVWLKRRRLAQAYRRSAVVIAVSEVARQSAIQYYGLPESLVQTIRNPVDADAIQGRRDDSAIAERASEGDLSLVVVGRMTEEKGHATLLDAIERLMKDWPAQLPTLHFRLIGDGPLRGGLESRWKDMVLAAGPKDAVHQVEFAGSIQPASAEIAAADGLVLPSHFEGLPNVVLEAFVLGTPVVATRAGGTVELQSSADVPTCYWAEPKDPDSLAQAIREFAGRAEQRRLHAVNAKRFALENHDLRATVDRISELLMSAQA